MAQKHSVEHFLHSKRKKAEKKDLATRQRQFVEIYESFDEKAAIDQASRCLQCGNPYCQEACPTGNYIPNWLKAVAEGNFELAAKLSHKTSSFPEICGRICPVDRLCEGACTLEDTKMGAVAISAVERFITDMAMKNRWNLHESTSFADSNKEVAIIGAGPAGLGCADILSRAGVQVHVFDKQNEIGGLLSFGIPSFKLEKHIVIRRRKLLQQQGVKFHFNVEVGKNLTFEELERQYDAIFLATGAYDEMQGGLLTKPLDGVYMALDYLISNTKANLGWHLDGKLPIDLAGKRVMILGGGDTAMDCNRTAIRQGAKEVICAYRRDKKNMPGSRYEVQNAEEEGVKFLWNTQPLELIGDQKITKIRLAKTRLSQPDSDGRRKPELVPASEFEVEVDAVIVAFGFKVLPLGWYDDFAIKSNANGTIQVSDHSHTNNPKVFAGGDAIRGASLVVTAMADGRLAGKQILEFLSQTAKK